MLVYCILISFIKCSFTEIEEMFRTFEDSDAPITEDSELHRYFSSPNIKFYFDKINKKLKISCSIEYSFVSEELYKLKKLETLDLSKNRLDRLPDSLGDLINLLELCLSNNRFIRIPSVIFKLEKLIYLDLNCNCIINIPEDMTVLKNLHTLMISNNFIENETFDFAKFTSIKILTLEGNDKICRLNSDNPNINDEIFLFNKIPKEIEQLNLSNTGLHFIPDLLDFPNLSYLDLSNNSLKKLSYSFKSLKQLKILNLENNEIRIFPPQLYQLRELSYLSIGENLITELIFPEQSCITLKTLILKDNPLERLIIESNALRELSILNLENTRLKDFRLKNTVTSEGGTIEPLTDMKVETITLRFESLDYIGELFDLHELTDLVIMCINKTTRTPQAELLSGLSNLQKLRFLSLGNCGLEAFPPLLINIPNLKILDLSNNFLTEVPTFIKDLFLERISLETNRIFKIPVEIFHNPQIKFLGLKGNEIENLPRNLSKHNKFTGIVDLSDNPIALFGNEMFSGIFDIPYTMVENIILKPIQLAVEQVDLQLKINSLVTKSICAWKEDRMFSLKAQKINEHTLEWNDIETMFDMLKNKISDTDLQDSTLSYLKKVYEISESTLDISIRYGLSQRNILKDYIEEILKLLLTFLESENNFIIENSFILLQDAHNVCFDGQLEHLIEIHKILTNKDLNCLEITIFNILVRYKYEGLKLITTSNSYSENVHLLSAWRNFFSETFGFEKIPNLYSAAIENPLLKSKTYLLFQMFKYLSVEKIVEELKNEINENYNLMTEVSGFLFQLFEKDLEKFQTMVTYDGDIDDLLITGITTYGVEAILLAYDLIEKRSK